MKHKMKKQSENKINQLIQILFSFPILFLCLVSCEGYRCAVGTIYDKYIQIPIENVKYRILESEQEYYSDSVGRYSICGKFGPVIPKPDIGIEFSKDGYSTIVIKNPNNANIYLERLHISNILEQNIVFCGKDDNAKLNNFEAEFLNNYIANRNDFDFYNKRILFITGSNGGTISSKTEYFENVKEWRERNNKIQTSLFALDKEEVELYEYDAIVLFWVKVFTTKTKNKVLEKSKY